ncbi:MAG TPA: ATP-binding protein [Polyangia bacterium]|jgi:PAS domain S-box-containing protein
MTKVAERARGWLRDRVRAIAEWPVRHELAALREQKCRLFAVLDAIEDAVIITEPDGRLRFANRRAASLLEGITGRGLDAQLGKRPDELELPAELQRYLHLRIGRVNETHAALTSEIAIAQPGGGARWFEEKISPVFSDGELTTQVMIGRDIDDRKRAERRLELLSKMSELAGDVELETLLPAIARLSIPELADWSAVDTAGEGTVRRMFVAARDPAHAAVAEKLQRFHPWSKRAGWNELATGRSLLYPEVDDELLRANAVNDEHLALLRRLGIRSMMAVPLSVRGAIVAVMSFATAESGHRYQREDLAVAEELARRAAVILDRAQLYAELATSEARFRVALGAGRTAVFEQDRALRYRWHYNSAIDISAVGKLHEDLFPLAEAAALDGIKRRVLESGQTAHEEVRLTLHGEPYFVALAIEPVRDERGEIVGIIGSGSDITREKKVQEELAQAVTFREQLMGILGHDLRNPLSAVVAAAGLLRRRGDLAAPVREHVERIERAATRMTEMIRTILDFTQVRFHGALPVWPEPTDLGEIARAIVDELRAAEPERAVELEVRGDARGRWDPARLGELMSNLVGNALEHGAAGEPVRVIIDVVGDELWLRVHNGGSAIAPALREALFEPFRRGEAQSGAVRSRGLGLGLYIVRQIVLAHGGAINVDSSDGDGTTFTVRLPRAAHDTAARAAVPGTISF